MRALGKQGVQKPDNVLGFKPLPEHDRAALETGRAMFETLQAQSLALDEAHTAMQEAAASMKDARERLTEVTADARTLWRALRVCAEGIREWEAEVDGLGLTPEVEAAMQVLVTLPYDAVLEPCPECAAGKHANCTGEVLNDADGLEPCPCGEAGHG